MSKQDNRPKCENCGRTLTGRRTGARTCGTACRVAWHRIKARLTQEGYPEECVTLVRGGGTVPKPRKARQ